MRAAVIPTHSRPMDFSDCVAAIRPQVDQVIAVAHGLPAQGYALNTEGVDDVVLYESNIPNISAMWRKGMSRAESGTRWVAVLNDDAIVSPGWFDTLQLDADTFGSVGASGPRGPGSDKISGFAFILDITSDVKPDERFRWWYSDDAIQRRCEAAGGFTICDRAAVEHRYPDKSTVGVLRRIAREDRPRFRQAYP